MHLTATNQAAVFSLAGLAAAALLLAVAILVDRLREPHRDPAGIVAVVDLRTARRALARAKRLDLQSGTTCAAAYRHLMGVRTWAAGERYYGTHRRRNAVRDVLTDANGQLTALHMAIGVHEILEPYDGPHLGAERYTPSREHLAGGA